jgi:hypothetical protein
MKIPLTCAYAFQDKLAEVDQQAQQLVRRFCDEDSCRAGAADSLLRLGVPARSLILSPASCGLTMLKRTRLTCRS